MKVSIYEIRENLGVIGDEAYFRIRNTEAPHDVRDLAVSTSHRMLPDLKVGWNGYMTFYDRKRPKGHAGANHLKLATATSDRWSDFPHYDGPDIAAGTPYVIEDDDGRPHTVLTFKEDVSAERMNEIAATLEVEKSVALGAVTIKYSYGDLMRELHARGIVEAWTPFTYSTPYSGGEPGARMQVTRPGERTDMPLHD